MRNQIQDETGGKLSDLSKHKSNINSRGLEDKVQKDYSMLYIVEKNKCIC